MDLEVGRKWRAAVKHLEVSGNRSDVAERIGSSPGICLELEKSIFFVLRNGHAKKQNFH